MEEQINQEPIEWKFGEASGGATVNKGDQVTLTANVDDPCYSEFVEWRDKFTEETVSVDNPLTVTADEPTIYQAVFRLKEYTVKLMVNNIRYGKVSQNGITYHLHDFAELSATPFNNCVFDGWYEDGVFLSGDPVFRYEISDCGTPKVVEGRFHQVTMQVVVSYDGAEISPYGISLV